MTGFVLRRLLSAIPTLILVSVIVFALVRLIPGDPAALMLGENADQAAIASMRASLGLDQPLPIQFLIWVKNIFQGDLGTSILHHESVAWLLWDRFQLSGLIILLSITISTVLAVSAGLFAAWRQNSLGDISVVILATLGLSLPGFWIGLLLLLAFGMKLGWLPVVGYVPFQDNPAEAWKFIVLPVLTLVIVEVGVLTRMARSSAIDVLRLEYITHARAKGLPERTVLFKHALPNAFAPTMTLVGIVIGTLLGGIAVVETVFTLPGLGRLLVEAIYARDYPVIQGCLLFISFVYVLLNLVIDLIYPLLDPRVTFE